MSKIALTQMKTVWHDEKINCATCERLTKKAKESNADLIVFPEMTLTGYTMETGRFADEELHRKTSAFFLRLSKQYKISILYGGIAPDKDKLPYNRLYLVSEGKTILTYDKLHPFSMAKENLYYQKGQKLVVEEVLLGEQTFSFAGFICYDLRFPEIFQAAADRGAEILGVIANWPAKRKEQFDGLLKARAIETQCYVFGVNCVGEDYEQIRYEPSSVAYDPQGRRLTFEGEQELLFFEPDKTALQMYRKEFAVRKDRRADLYVFLQKKNAKI